MLQFTDIQAAAARIEGHAHRTPVLTSRTLDALLGAQVFMKAENLQRMGAFKFRGGYNAVNVLTDAQRARGVVAFSSGNHAQAVGQHPWAVIQPLVTDVLTASDPVVVDAMRFAFERLKVVLEPSGACALAAVMTHRAQFEGQRVGITLSGGNIGLDRFVALVSGAEKVD